MPTQEALPVRAGDRVTVAVRITAQLPAERGAIAVHLLGDLP